MALSKRLKNTRIVTFKEDYKAGGRTIYKAGSEHAIHNVLADKLQKQIGKDGVKIKKFDEDTIEKAKLAFEKAQKDEAKDA